MTDTVRKAFEVALQERLREAFVDQPRVSVVRNEVRVRAEAGRAVVGRLALDHVTAARGYVLIGWADEPAELRALRDEVQPPYGSRLLTEAAMAFTTSGERSREFAPTAGGAVLAPTTEPEVEPTCDMVVERITGIFLPRVLDLADLRPGVVDGVAANPDHYAWPVLTAVAAMRKHGLSRADVDAERLLGRKVSGNRAFDARLLDSLA